MMGDKPTVGDCTLEGLDGGAAVATCADELVARPAHNGPYRAHQPRLDLRSKRGRVLPLIDVAAHEGELLVKRDHQRRGGHGQRV